MFYNNTQKWLIYLILSSYMIQPDFWQIKERKKIFVTLHQSKGLLCTSEMYIIYILILQYLHINITPPYITKKYNYILILYRIFSYMNEHTHLFFVNCFSLFYRFFFTYLYKNKDASSDRYSYTLLHFKILR